MYEIGQLSDNVHTKTIKLQKLIFKKINKPVLILIYKELFLYLKRQKSLGTLDKFLA